MNRIEELIRELRSEIDECDSSREKSLALTKLDECQLWLTRTVRTMHPGKPHPFT